MRNTQKIKRLQSLYSKEKDKKYSESRSNNHEQSGLFLTQSSTNKDRKKKSWKSQGLIKNKSNKINIDSWEDLNILKSKYRKQRLLLKGKEKLCEENFEMIMKLQDTPPKIQAWNKTPKFNNSINQSVGSIKQKLFQQNLQLIDKLQNAPPKVQSWNKNFIQLKSKSSPKQISRDKSRQVLFQENMKMVQKLQETPPKVDAWNYATIISKKKLQKKKQERKKSTSMISQKNIKMIQKIESTPPKVQPWNSVKSLKLKVQTRKDRIYNPQNIERTLSIMKEKIDTAQRILTERQRSSKSKYSQNRCLTEMKQQLIRNNKKDKRSYHDFVVQKNREMVKKVQKTSTTMPTVKKMTDYSYSLMLEMKKKKEQAELMKRTRQMQKKKEVMLQTFATHQ